MFLTLFRPVYYITDIWHYHLVYRLNDARQIITCLQWDVRFSTVYDDGAKLKKD